MNNKEYAHAYLEILRLIQSSRHNFRKEEVESKMRNCEKHLDPEEMGIIRELASP